MLEPIEQSPRARSGAIFSLGLVLVVLQLATGGRALAGTYFPPAGESLAQQDQRSPAAVGLDAGLIDDLRSKINQGRWAVWRDGYLVHVEGSFNSTDEVKSTRKTFHAATLGAMIQLGLIGSVNQNLDDWNAAKSGGPGNCHEQATLWHVITQTTAYDDSGRCPGDIWAYSDANPPQLNRVLARAWFGDNSAGFTSNYDEVIGGALLDPIGASGWSISTKSDGVRLHLDLEDLGRLGLLLSTGGMWEQTRILPDSFEVEMSRRQTGSVPDVNYDNANDGATELLESDFPRSPYGYFSWVNTGQDLWPGAAASWATALGASGSYVAWDRSSGLVLAILGSNDDIDAVPGDSRPGWPIPIRSAIESLEAHIDGPNPLLGGGGGGECSPGQTRTCGASDVGLCQLGLETCDASSSWGSCIGAVGPASEICNDGVDQDCDGSDLFCECSDGATRPCGIGTGACEEGTEACVAGSWSGLCSGETGPAPEICENGIDENCDGQDAVCADPELGLVLEHRFDRDAGAGESDTFVFDWSAQGNSGTVSGATFTADGWIDGAFHYDGVDDRIEIADAASLGFEGWPGATVALWARPDRLDADDEQTLYGHWNGAKSRRPFQLLLQQDNRWQCRTNNKDGVAASASTATLGQWTHIACVWTPDGLAIYVDGVSEATDDAVQGVLDSNPARHTIGAREKSGSLSQHFEGAIDELAIWDRALDDAEIQDRYTATSGGTECTPAEVRSCGVSAVGACALGSETCDGDGFWGVCVGSQGPEPETCGDGIDQDCDGADLGCECVGSEVEACYSGPPGSAGVGICSAGSRSCSGGFWGTCAGEVTPQLEICGDGIDQDCDGTDAVCAQCTNGDTRPCGVATGQCEPGLETCVGGQWSGLCEGAVSPQPEICDNGLDEDCNGQDETCGGGGPDPGEAQVLEYRFDSAAAGAQDSSGQDNDGSVVGATFTNDGRIGGAFEYDGSNDHVAVVDTPSLDLNAAPGVTVAFWARPARLDHSDEQTLYGHWNDSRSQRAFQVLLLPDNRWQCRTNHDNGVAESGAGASLGVWTHVACVWTPAGLSLFVDGVAAATDSDVQASLDPNSGAHTIGAREKGGDLSQRFLGTIDEFGIWTRALTGPELQGLAQGASQP